MLLLFFKHHHNHYVVVPYIDAFGDPMGLLLTAFVCFVPWIWMNEGSHLEGGDFFEWPRDSFDKGNSSMQFHQEGVIKMVFLILTTAHRCKNNYKHLCLALYRGNLIQMAPMQSAAPKWAK